MVLARFCLNEAGSSAMVISKVSLSFTVAVGLRFEYSMLGGRVMFRHFYSQPCTCSRSAFY